MIGDTERAPDATPVSPEEILQGLKGLVEEKKLFGAARDPAIRDAAEFDPGLVRKKGKGSRFIIRKAPSAARLLRRWTDLFGGRISPRGLLGALAVRTEEFEHRQTLLLFSRRRILYDAEIFQGGESVGELTLSFASVRGPAPGVFALLRGPRLKVVYIEHIHLTARRSGYASTLLKHYEELFRGLRFREFRLHASLSIGKYYWAKEGFDFADRSEARRRKDELFAFVRDRNLPVRGIELSRLNHAYEFARFRADLKVPAFRDADGYHSLRREARFTEEIALPLGKAYLLAAPPWEGYKLIHARTPRKTGFVTSRKYLRHRTRRRHPESPGRLRLLLRAVEDPDLKQSLVLLEPYVPDLEFLERVHSAGYLARFRESVRTGEKTFLTQDCSIGPASWDVALLAAGGVMAGVDAVMGGQAENAFCAVRPPGHHTGKESTMGFCFINNVAVGAVYARAAWGVERIFILDWDVHHGNGTQEIFETDPLTYYCSIHEHPTFCFPGTGRRLDRGTGPGAGFTLNLPLMPLAGDEELTEVFETSVVPEINRFEPGLIMISAGFDGHEGDPIADLRLSEGAFAYMTRRLCALADRHCSGRIVSVLEGGYAGPSFASSALAHIRALQGRSKPCSSERE